MYKGEPLEVVPPDFIGFIYLITRISDGKKYIGKKKFGNKKTSTKTVLQKNGIKKKKKIRSIIESDWRDYWSSSDSVKEDVQKLGKDAFSREIIYLCKTESEMTYLESREIFDKRALESDMYYNAWVMCRIRKSNVLGKINDQT